MALGPFESTVHSCVKCRELSVGFAIQHYPIISFGSTENKSLIVVGLNPSTSEYDKKFVSSSLSIEERHQSQMNYFNKLPYTFFKNLAKYFENPVKKKLGWARSPWEKVGYLDIVKCSVRAYPRAPSQWGSLSKGDRELIIDTCSPYLHYQLRLIKPRLVMAYGADVCRWFYPSYTADDSFKVKTCTRFGDLNFGVILVPQTRGSHSVEVIEQVKKEIAKRL